MNKDAHRQFPAARSQSTQLPTMPDESPRVLSVSELARKLRMAVEASAHDAWVEGEVTSFKAAASGHLYFNLKDEREDACVECVMYRASAIRARGVLADGSRVQVRGRATVWAPRGKLQFVVDAARAAGRGALLEALEQLKIRLTGEGLFAAEKKRKLPAEPRIIGVVTSASGAAIHDIARVAFRRGAARILLAPAVVQGTTAPREIIAAIDRLESVNGVDVIIVGRGGGAADDLAAFQDEMVVRRVAACRVPVISAVGHEVDVTLTDLAADVRAATPSQAAEMLVPELFERARRLEQTRLRLARAMHGRMVEDRMALERLERRIGDPRTLLGERQQLLDDLHERSRRTISKLVVKRRESVMKLSARLSARHPRAVVEVARGRISGVESDLETAMSLAMRARSSRVAQLAGRLSALSPLAVLARGYAIALGEGRAVTRASDLSVGDSLRIRVHRGEAEATVTAIHPETDSDLTNVEGARRSDRGLCLSFAGAERHFVRPCRHLPSMARLLRFALLGHPVEQSASPAMHTASFRTLGLPHTYEAVPCPSIVALKAAVGLMKNGGIAGLNITMPWKKEVLALVDGVDLSASDVDAANTLVRRTDGKVWAHNTDVPALAEELGRLEPRVGTAVIIGAGGAASAALEACKRLGVRVIGVTSRRWSSSEILYEDEQAIRFRERGALTMLWPTPESRRSTSHVSSALRLQWYDLAGSANLVIQATSAALVPSVASPAHAIVETVPWPVLDKSAVAFDVVYRTQGTPFLESAQRAGLRNEGGLGMLVRQGALAQDLWLGKSAPYDVMRSAAVRHLAAVLRRISPCLRRNRLARIGATATAASSSCWSRW